MSLPGDVNSRSESEVNDLCPLTARRHSLDSLNPNRHLEVPLTHCLASDNESCNRASRVAPSGWAPPLASRVGQGATGRQASPPQVVSFASLTGLLVTLALVTCGVRSLDAFRLA